MIPKVKRVCLGEHPDLSRDEAAQAVAFVSRAVVRTPQPQILELHEARDLRRNGAVQFVVYDDQLFEQCQLEELGGQRPDQAVLLKRHCCRQISQGSKLRWECSGQAVAVQIQPIQVGVDAEFCRDCAAELAITPPHAEPLV